MLSSRFNQLKSAFAVNQYMTSEGPLESSCNHRPHGWQWDHTCRVQRLGDPFTLEHLSWGAAMSKPHAYAEFLILRAAGQQP